MRHCSLSGKELWGKKFKRGTQKKEETECFFRPHCKESHLTAWSTFSNRHPTYNLSIANALFHFVGLPGIKGVIVKL